MANGGARHHCHSSKTLILHTLSGGLATLFVFRSPFSVPRFHPSFESCYLALVRAEPTHRAILCADKGNPCSRLDVLSAEGAFLSTDHPIASSSFAPRARFLVESGCRLVSLVP